MPPVDESEAEAKPDASGEPGPWTSGGSDTASNTDADTISPDKGDFSVAPVDDGPSAQGETTSPIPESTERSDTVSGTRSDDTVSGSRSGGSSPGTRATGAGAAAATAAPASREKVVERRGGFFPMLLGGIVAAAIGFGLSQYLGPNGWPFSDDGSLFEDETRTALGETQSGLEDTRTGLEDLGARIDAIEGNLGDADFADIQQVVATLTSAVEDIRAEIGASTPRSPRWTNRRHPRRPRHRDREGADGGCRLARDRRRLRA